MKNITRRTAAVLVVLLGVLGAGVAFAAWTQTGTGSGQAKAKTAVASTITAGTAVADLYPGKTGGNVIFTVNNPNDYPVTFTSLAAGAVTSSDPTNCPAVQRHGDHPRRREHRRRRPAPPARPRRSPVSRTCSPRLPTGARE